MVRTSPLFSLLTLSFLPFVSASPAMAYGTPTPTCQCNCEADDSPGHDGGSILWFDKAMTDQYFDSPANGSTPAKQQENCQAQNGAACSGWTTNELTNPPKLISWSGEYIDCGIVQKAP